MNCAAQFCPYFLLPFHLRNSCCTRTHSCVRHLSRNNLHPICFWSLHTLNTPNEKSSCNTIYDLDFQFFRKFKMRRLKSGHVPLKSSHLSSFSVGISYSLVAPSTWHNMILSISSTRWLCLGHDDVSLLPHIFIAFPVVHQLEVNLHTHCCRKCVLSPLPCLSFPNLCYAPSFHLLFSSSSPNNQTSLLR